MTVKETANLSSTVVVMRRDNHSMEQGRIHLYKRVNQGVTERRTDGRTDRPSYRGAS